MKLHDVEQGGDEWFALRRGLPTASEASRIITASGKPSASQEAYMAELIDEMVRPDSQEAFAGNRHTERGHALEPQAREWFRFASGQDVRVVGFVTRDDGLIGCSPDALIYADSNIAGGVEIKAPEGKKHVLWMLGAGLPDEHKQQVHASMAVTGLRIWHFASYCPGYKPFRIRVEWDKYTDAVASEIDNFAIKLEAAKAKFIEYLPPKEAA